MRAPTGQQCTITHEAPPAEPGGAPRLWRATITELAATLRELTLDGIDLVEPFAEDARPAKGQGIVLAPWGGRVRDATWMLGDEQQRLAITDVGSGNAIHGLLRYTAYRVLEHDASSVLLAATIYPQPGWPFLIDTTVRYALGDDGLTVTHEATNVGTVRAPWACGAHPYLAVGDVPAGRLTLTVPASTIFVPDAGNVPVAEVAVDADDAPGADLRAGAPLSELELDFGYGGVQHDGGRAVSTLLDGAGRGTAIWQDESFGWVVVFTPHDFPRTRGIGQVAAVEPMSAPANALNTGEGLAWLEPGDSWRGQWGITAVGL